MNEKITSHFAGRQDGCWPTCNSLVILYESLANSFYTEEVISSNGKTEQPSLHSRFSKHTYVNQIPISTTTPSYRELSQIIIARIIKPLYKMEIYGILF